MPLLRLFTATPAHGGGVKDKIAGALATLLGQDASAVTVEQEMCFNIETAVALEEAELGKLTWLLTDASSSDAIQPVSGFAAAAGVLAIEVGPRLNVMTPFSTNAISICKSIDLEKVSRVECSRRVSIKLAGADLSTLPAADTDKVAAVLHDRMTECVYVTALDSFATAQVKEAWETVDVLGKGTPELKAASDKLGLAFDDADLEYYTKLFTERIQRNPTTVECFDLSQSNSEHSRHWFFTGRLIIDGAEQPQSLMKLVKKTQTETQPNNSIIAFHDNSSALVGYEVPVMAATVPDGPGKMDVVAGTTRHITLTAETHNFPTGVAPFPGATTGTGGRIRDNQSTGRGAHVIAGSAGYCVGNLAIPGYAQPWEDGTFAYPSTMASPLDIQVQASNGASDYGNKFGEPIITGFSRSFGMRLPSGERREWVKPIMFTSGLGTIDSTHVDKEAAEKGFLIVKVGGPAYRIGMGGGSASSVDVQGGGSQRDANLDFNAVQRGDAEMEQKLNRVIRACVELGDRNPIKSIHDQGAGGNGNVLKEICEPAGAVIHIKNFVVGDPTLSTMELWGAEYQENNALLIAPGDRDLLASICHRERVPVAFVGEVTGDGRVILVEADHKEGEQHPFDLTLKHTLSEVPRKCFYSDRSKKALAPLVLPASLTVRAALDRVLRLVHVGSKRFLTNKVDRSVTGLIAQQQCVGPLHTPLANVAVVALSHYDTKGAATAIGEQPIKGLVDIKAGARMSVGECLTNLVWAEITDLKDVKCSGNWMWAAKLAGEGAALHDACVAMCDVITDLGFAVDGGKDSLSMAARVEGEANPVKAPGELVITAYAACPDITTTVTPDLQGGSDSAPQPSVLLHVDIGGGKRRMGGSALAQVFSQIGDSSPDVDAPVLEAAFRTTQELVKAGTLLAGHDISDGGFITTLLEMCFAGNRGATVAVVQAGATALEAMFAEELGFVLEVEAVDAAATVAAYAAKGVPCVTIGSVMASTADARIKISYGDDVVVDEAMVVLRDVWEGTSFELEKLQTAAECVAQEASGMASRTLPPYTIAAGFVAAEVVPRPLASPVRVATIREEGSNGDREMIAALHMAGFDVFDVTMSDILAQKITLDQFRGVVFVGGFSYADTCGSAKGWAGGILYNDVAKAQFDRFRQRGDTFSLGICNGCQLMALLGWVGSSSSIGTGAQAMSPSKKPKTGAGAGTEMGTVLGHNKSGRFESRFSAVTIRKSPAVLFAGMEGCTLGVWVAHGEGLFKFSSPALAAAIKDQELAPLRYVDDANEPTTAYPFNPNGSPDGIAGLCSSDGRHLAMMPHPERGVMMWQWPWLPKGWNKTGTSPWLKIFANGKAWCDQSA